METIFLGVVIFLLVLAVFDLVIGVSNDAVNFLNSAVGSKAAGLKTIMIIASLGIFLGASFSNGMMDIARHGILLPTHFSFYEIMCVFVAVMITDVILLDIFNSLGMPTSTTVSMVFELLGGAFILSILKLADDTSGVLSFGNLLNTEKALSVIVGIFLSVAIAFFAGLIVQWVSRVILTFNYQKHMKWYAGVLGGSAITALAYFMLIKGFEGSSLMSLENKIWIREHTGILLAGSFIFFSILTQILHIFGINILKIIVLLGTFSLAMAFAGNDLVNFIGVPLAGLASYTDFVNNGQGDIHSFYMESLNESASTPSIFLFLAGLIMIVSLATSKKAKNVIKTSVSLSRQEEGEELFGTSALARSIVRGVNSCSNNIARFIPNKIRTGIRKRFNKDEVILKKSAAFDLVRAAINLVLAGLLITIGTNMKLPLSTTYVTFMVAMGTSLADKAWGRESAVFRITGVISVIGGWFLTAGAAFIICSIMVVVIYYGGISAIVILIGIATFLLIKSDKNYRKRTEHEKEDHVFEQIMKTDDKDEALRLINIHVRENVNYIIETVIKTLENITDGMIREDLKALKKGVAATNEARSFIKRNRRKEIIAMKKIDENLAIEKNTWIYLCSDSCEQIIFSLKHIGEPCKEHVDNNFEPLPDTCIKEYLPLRDRIVSYLEKGSGMVTAGNYNELDRLRYECDMCKQELSVLRKKQLERVRKTNSNVNTALVYLTILQESQELVTSFRHLMRATANFQQ